MEKSNVIPAKAGTHALQGSARPKNARGPRSWLEDVGVRLLEVGVVGPQSCMDMPRGLPYSALYSVEVDR